MFKVSQLRVGGFDHNFAYLIVNNGEAAVIDPCGDAKVILEALRDSGAKLRYILLTHGHKDHTSAINAIRKAHPAPVLGHTANKAAKEPLDDHQCLPLGSGHIETLYAPGHTPDSMLYRLSDDSALFTGDTLFIGCCGYCDPQTMFDTMRNVIYPLADSLMVYSGHDYGPVPYRALGDEKRDNPYLNTSDFTVFKQRLKEL